jgi:nitronate monooxygenase
MWSNAFIRDAGIDLPIIQAPMAGGATTPELVAAVSNAGALGSFAAAYASPAEIASAIAAIRRLTDRPFAVNVFAPLDATPPDDPSPMLAVVARLYAELGLAPPSLPSRPPIALEEQLAAIVEARVPVVSFTFGLLPDDAVSRLHAAGAYLIGTATTVDEALALERQGIDAVVAQGSEAGGHRGSFHAAAPAGLVGTMALVPQIADAVRIPVIAAGGIMDGRGIAAARLLGASAAQLGTAFLTCTESGVPPAVKEALLRANENDTVVTNAVTGRHGRAVRNRLTDAFEAAAVPPLGFAWQSALLGGLRRAVFEQGRADLLPLFAGQGLRLLRVGGAGELVRELVRETGEAYGSPPL